MNEETIIFADLAHKIKFAYPDYTRESANIMPSYFSFAIYEMNGGRWREDSTIEGTLKWDGCMDIHSSVVHLCGPEGARAFYRVITKVFDKGTELGYEI